jgi:hypothetical protein
VPAGQLVEGTEGLLPAAEPAGVGEPGEDIAARIRGRVAEATSKVKQAPVSGAPNKPEQQAPIDTRAAG